jgi:hypothetical protein
MYVVHVGRCGARLRCAADMLGLERAWGNGDRKTMYDPCVTGRGRGELPRPVSRLRDSIHRLRYLQLHLCVTARLPRLSRARAGCVCAGRGRRLRLLELSLRRWRACVRALAMSSSHGNGMAARRASRGCTAVVAACRACGAADEACAVKMVLEASEVAHSVAYSSAET